MPQTMFSEAEVADLIRSAAREAAEATRRVVREEMRAEVDRASRRRMTTREAARYLSMGRRALLDLAEAGRIAYEDRGGSVGYVFNRVDLDALADELTSTPT